MLEYSVLQFKGFNSCSKWRCQTYIGAWNIILTCCSPQRPRSRQIFQQTTRHCPETGPDTSCMLSSKGDNQQAMPDSIVRGK